MDNRFEFLNGAISDAQELIRFIDTKTAAAVTILSAYVIVSFSKVENILQYSHGYSIWFWVILSLFFIFLILCIVVTVGIIRPTTNPVDNVSIGEEPLPSIKFFLSPNDYSQGKLHALSNSSKFKLGENFKNYIQQLGVAQEADILKCLALELFKVSYIRNIKNDRFNILLYLLLLTTALFFTSYLFCCIETANTIQQLKIRPH